MLDIQMKNMLDAIFFLWREEKDVMEHMQMIGAQVRIAGNSGTLFLLTFCFCLLTIFYFRHWLPSFTCISYLLEQEPLLQEHCGAEDDLGVGGGGAGEGQHLPMVKFWELGRSI